MHKPQNYCSSRGALALDGFFSIVSPTIDVVVTGDLEADLATQAKSIVALFRDTRTGPVLAGLIAEAQSNPDLAEALRTLWLDPRREAGAVVPRAAKQDGEMRADVDTTMVLDQIYVAIYIRLLLGHRRHGYGDDPKSCDSHQKSVAANAQTTYP